jgi:hypothetical protein
MPLSTLSSLPSVCDGSEIWTEIAQWYKSGVCRRPSPHSNSCQECRVEPHIDRRATGRETAKCRERINASGHGRYRPLYVRIAYRGLDKSNRQIRSPSGEVPVK